MTSPSRVYSRSDPGFALAALALERAAGIPYATLVGARVLAPLGMDASSLDHDDAAPRLTPGHEVPDPPTELPTPVTPAPESALMVPVSVLYSTAADLATLAAALMNGGRVRGEAKLPADVVARVLRPMIAIPGDEARAAALGLTLSTWEGRPQIDLTGGGPGHGMTFRVLPDDRLAVVVFTNVGGINLHGVSEFVLRRLLGLGDPPSPALLARVRAAVRAADARTETLPPASALAGTYANGGEVIALVDDGGALRLRSGDMILDVEPAGGGLYRAKIADGRVALVFRVVPDGVGGRYLFIRDRALVRVEEKS